MKTVKGSFKNDFKVDECLLEFYKNKEIDDIERATSLSMHKGAIHCGSFSSDKMNRVADCSNTNQIVLRYTESFHK